MFLPIKRLYCSFLFILFAEGLLASVKLPPVLSDHMVLQQFSWISLWGKADPGENISVMPGWDGKTYAIQADPTGRWKVKLFTGRPGGPYNLILKGSNQIEVKDILIGDVWVCSGQSNMDFTFKDLGGWKEYADVKKLTDSISLRDIRLCTIAKNPAREPLDSCGAAWKPADTSSILNFSAVAFYFGLELRKKFGIPVGLVLSAWSGSPAQAWTPKEYLQFTPGLSYYLDSNDDRPFDAFSPSALFNGMIHPIRNFSIRGFIWYQGESNRLDFDLYTDLFSSMIRSWRKYWDQPELPFDFVQIAPFDYQDYDEASGFLREAQNNALEVDNTGMAVTLDIGNLRDIHPKNKKEVGRRLALQAFARTYGQPAAGSSAGPSYWFSRVEDDRIVVYFKDAENLYGNPAGLTGFRIAGLDGIFKPARALIEGNSVTVWNQDVTSPKHVRYAFLDTDTASLFDGWGLPAGSFRTDSLKVNYRTAKIKMIPDVGRKGWKAVLSCKDRNAGIRYSLDGLIPGPASGIYTDTLRIDQSCILTARVFLGDIPSLATSEVKLQKHEALGLKAELKNLPEKKYAGGEFTLTDGVHGNQEFRDGRWLGFRGSDMDAEINLDKDSISSSVRVTFLADTASWIYPPETVILMTRSQKGKWKTACTVEIGDVASVRLKDNSYVFPVTMVLPMTTDRLIRILAICRKTKPEAASDPKDKSWLFADEIECNSN